MSAVDVLERALERISRPGAWGQMRNRWFVRGASCCAWTAISDEGGSSWFPATDFLSQAIGLEKPYRATDVWNWNDAEGRTLEEVQAAFRRAIELARGAP